VSGRNRAVQTTPPVSRPRRPRLSSIRRQSPPPLSLPLCGTSPESPEGSVSLPRDHVRRIETAWEDRPTKRRATSGSTFPREETAWEDRPTRRRATSGSTFPQESSTRDVGLASLPVCTTETAWEDRPTKGRATSESTFSRESSTPDVGRASLPVFLIETAWEDRPTKRRTLYPKGRRRPGRSH
jgi:hypothetical protein